MEDDKTNPDALNVVVAFTPAEAMVFDEDDAKKLCQRLNRYCEILITNGYDKLEITRAI